MLAPDLDDPWRRRGPKERSSGDARWFGTRMVTEAISDRKTSRELLLREHRNQHEHIEHVLGGYLLAVRVRLIQPVAGCGYLQVQPGVSVRDQDGAVEGRSVGTATCERDLVGRVLDRESLRRLVTMEI